MALRRRIVAFPLFLALTALIGAGVGSYAFSEDVARLADRGRANLSLATDRLVGQLLNFRQLVVILADYPAVKGALAAPDAPAPSLSPLLLRFADISGSLDLMVIRTDGQVIATAMNTVGRDYPPGPEFTRALHGALGFDHRVDPETGRRIFVYAAPVFSDAGPVIGVVALRIDATAVETAWRGEPQAIFFTDQADTVFISNRDELLLRQTGSGGADFGPSAVHSLAGEALWRVQEGSYIPGLAIHLSQPLPVIDLEAHSLVSVEPALRQALLQAGVAVTLLFAFGAILFALSERRRALAGRLAVEAAANARLEERVAVRTRELSQANEQLRKAQQELVQAGKLSALGQMSAGISHELNQPLMAIQTFAGNATQFLGRGDTGAVGRNLEQIAELARRMGRIIRNLRAFARQESVPASTVDLVAVVDAALELSDPRLREGGVALHWARPEAPVLVRGGEVRLQQVVMNLVTNAADAMEGLAGRALSLAIEQRGGSVILRVADTGPGISEPEKIFDPFYSTKEVGHSEGMGLGLSISYGLVQSFGGKIAGRNRPGGGAEFTVELTAPHQEQAA